MDLENCRQIGSILGHMKSVFFIPRIVQQHAWHMYSECMNLTQTQASTLSETNFKIKIQTTNLKNYQSIRSVTEVFFFLSFQRFPFVEYW